MMGAVVHSNVGLMHASMAVFNAWCDRLPLLLLGATGPWDAARRRPRSSTRIRGWRSGLLQPPWARPAARRQGKSLLIAVAITC